MNHPFPAPHKPYSAIKNSRNPLSGRKASGFRFLFRNRDIAHNSLFLPLEMKSLPQIQKLKSGISPLDVFNCNSLIEARLAFYRLRKKYDFDYWAATEYLIKDMRNADDIVPLFMNSFQNHIIDIFQRRYFQRKHAAYIISKSFPKCGVTTCVQAYILWRQIYHWAKNSITCAASDINIQPLRDNICRFLHRTSVHHEKKFLIPFAECYSFFNTFRTPDALRGIDLGYVHLANMSLWYDPDGKLSSRVFSASTGGVLLRYYSLIVLEGNIPDSVYASQPGIYRNLFFNRPLSLFSNITRNPYFLRQVASAYDPIDNGHQFFNPIDLDHELYRIIKPNT